LSSDNSDTVQAVRIHRRGSTRPGTFQLITIPRTHPVFEAACPLSPVSHEIGIPLRIYREAPLDPKEAPTHPDRAKYDCQIATYLMIEIHSGYAPGEWQCGVGDVIVARADGRPTSVHLVEGVWMFCDRLLDMFGDGEGAVVPERDITKGKFRRFWKNYKEERVENGAMYGVEGWSSVSDDPYA
ncbi:hypothetical protein HDV00_009340, partial [Rhizophlyctis rosea]